MGGRTDSLSRTSGLAELWSGYCRANRWGTTGLAAMRLGEIASAPATRGAHSLGCLVLPEACGLPMSLRIVAMGFLGVSLGPLIGSG
jgi:hypothetical protein